MKNEIILFENQNVTLEVNMKFRRKEYNRKIRHSKITEDASSRAYNKNLTKLVWNTLT